MSVEEWRLRPSRKLNRMFIEHPGSVWYKQENGFVFGPEAVVAPFPKDDVLSEFVAPRADPNTASSAKTNRYDGIPNTVRCVQVTIRKRATAARDNDAYEVWINGSKTLPDAIETVADGELVFTLPAFQSIFRTTSKSGAVDSAACVTPVAVSLLVEQGTRFPESATVTSEQFYQSGTGNDRTMHSEPDQRQDLFTKHSLFNTTSESITCPTILLPYPAATPRDPFVVIRDMRARRLRNSKAYKRLIVFVLVGFAAFALGVAAMPSQFVVSQGVQLLIARLTAANSAQLFHYFANLLDIRQFFSGVGLVLKDAARQSTQVAGSYILFEFIKDSLLTLIKGPQLPPVRDVEFTFPDIYNVLRKIRPNSSAPDYQAMVLLDWMKEAQGWRQWRFIGMLVGAFNFITRNLFSKEFVPRSNDISMKGCKIEYLRQKTLVNEIAVEVHDTSECDVQARRFVLRARHTEAFQAGLVHASVDQQIETLEREIALLQARLQTNTDGIREATLRSTFGVPSHSNKDRWYFTTLQSIYDTVPENIAKFFAALGDTDVAALQRGLEKLNSQLINSDDVAALRRKPMDRVGMIEPFDECTLSDGVVRRLLPQRIRVDAVARPSAIAPTVNFIAFNTIDTQTEGDPTGLTTTAIAEFKPVHKAAVHASRTSFDAVSALRVVIANAESRPLIRQYWGGDLADVSAGGTPVVLIRARLTRIYSCTCAETPMDIVEKLIAHEASNSGADVQAYDWVTRNSDTHDIAALLGATDVPSKAAAAASAASAFSEIVIDAQLDRYALPREKAIMHSVSSLVKTRVELVLSLFDAFVERSNDSKQPHFRLPSTHDPCFLRPGGVDCYKLLHRLGLLRALLGTYGLTLAAPCGDLRNADPVGTDAVPLSLACRELVSRETFVASDPTMSELLLFPRALSVHARNGIEAFKLIARSSDALQRHMPVMASFVTSETLHPWNADDAGIGIRLQDALAAIEVTSLFSRGAGMQEIVVVDLATVVVQSRPSLLLLPTPKRLTESVLEHSQANRMEQEVRNARRGSPYGRRLYSDPLSTFNALRQRCLTFCTTIGRVVELLDAADASTTRLGDVDILLPFGSGDGQIQTLRFPAPTILKMDTVPIEIDALLHRFPSTTKPKCVGIVVDRSTAMRDTRNIAGNPLCVQLRNGNSDVGTFQTASVVLSQAYLIEQTPTPSGPIPQETNQLLAFVLSNVGSAEPLRTASELIWNSERIMQACLVLLGSLRPSDASVEICVQKPVGWVIGIAERNRRIADARRIERQLQIHKNRKLTRAAEVWDALWQAVVNMRRGVGVPPPPPSITIPGTGRDVPVDELGAIDLENLGKFGKRALGNSTPISRQRVVFTGADVDGDGVPLVVQEGNDEEEGEEEGEEEEQALSIESRIKVESRPEQSQFLPGEPVDLLFSDVAEDVTRTRNELVERFMEFVRPFNAVEEGGDDATFETARYAKYFGGDDGKGAVARETLERAFDSVHTGSIVAWKQRLKELEYQLATKQAQFVTWVDNAIRLTEYNNLKATSRFMASVRLAQAMLLQTLGKQVAPRLVWVSNDNQAQSTHDKRMSTLVNRVIRRGCEACLRAEGESLKWLTLGELARILVQIDVNAQDADDGDDDDSDRDGDDEDDNDGKQGDQIPAASSGHPLAFVSALGAPLRVTRKVMRAWIRGRSAVDAASKRPRYAPLPDTTDLQLPNRGLVDLARAITESPPILSFHIGENELRDARIAQVMVAAFNRGEPPFEYAAWKEQTVARSDVFSVNAPLDLQLQRPWSPALIGQNFRTADALRCLITDGYLSVVGQEPDAIVQIRAAASDAVVDGTIPALQAVADALGDEAQDATAVIDRCSTFDDRPLLKALCAYLRETFSEYDPDGGIVAFRIDEDVVSATFVMEDLLKRIQDENVTLEAADDDPEGRAQELGKALDTLFALPKTDSWTLQDGGRVLSRRLPSFAVRSNYRKMKTFIVLLTARTALITRLAPVIVFAFVVLMYFGVPLTASLPRPTLFNSTESVLTSNTDWKSPRFEEGVSEPGAVAAVTPTAVERVAVLMNTIWVHMAGPSTSASPTDDDRFLQRFRFILTQSVLARTPVVVPRGLGSLEDAGGAPTSEIPLSVSINEPLAAEDDTTIAWWLAAGLGNAVLSVVEWHVEAWLG